MNHSLRLKRQFKHDLIANLATLRSLVAVSSPPDRAMELIGHIAGSQSVWLSRLGYEEAPLPVWPSLTLVECERQLRRLAAVWTRLLDTLEPDWLDTEISYRNSSGTEWRNTVSDVISHVLLHSAYHRGQIAILLRQAGAVPAITDLIATARTGMLDEPLPGPTDNGS